MTLSQLTYFLNQCWSKETCYPLLQSKWNEKERSIGQCAVTALILNEYFGGKICKCKVGEISFYFNKINDEIIDLTGEQFGDINIQYEPFKEKTREQLLENEDTKKRYQLLKLKLDQKLESSETIYF